MNDPKTPYRALCTPWSAGSYGVFGSTGCVDHYHTRSAAEHYARMLNSGAAVINPHATIGCRVEVRFPDGLPWD